jgi:hypothetical protein
VRVFRFLHLSIPCTNLLDLSEAGSPGQGWVLDGFPYTAEQAAVLLTAKTIPTSVIVLTAGTHFILKRVS